MPHADGQLPSVLGEYNEVMSVATIDHRGYSTSSGCLGGWRCPMTFEGEYGELSSEMDQDVTSQPCILPKVLVKVKHDMYAVDLIFYQKRSNTLLDQASEENSRRFHCL